MSIEWLVTQFLSAWLLPPLNLLAVIAAGLVLAPRRPRLGLWIAGVGLMVLAALSTGVVGNSLLSTLENGVDPISATALRKGKSGAIVILGGGRNRGSPEYGGETVSLPSLARVRYGARLAHESGLPILVTSGKPDGGGKSEAELMAEVLEKDFGVKARWLETESINTIQNAQFSQKILAKAGIKRVILVTDAWHMPRSVERFRNAGLEAVPAPTNYKSRAEQSPLAYLPSAEGLRNSSIAFHEWIGILVTRARGV